MHGKLLALSAVLLGSLTLTGYAQTNLIRAQNKSTATECSEVSNINIPLTGVVTSFVVEATHPTYDFSEDNCERDLSGCPAMPADNPNAAQITKLYDDGESVIEAVTEPDWWRPKGMSVSVDKGQEASNVHYLRLYRRSEEKDSWPQFLIFYSDGSMRLNPQPPVGKQNVCFGSSVIIGPAAVADKPFADVIYARYVSLIKRLFVVYKNGGQATLDLSKLNRETARVKVTVNYPTDKLPFATFRSMYVAPEKADVNNVRWTEAGGKDHEIDIMTFTNAVGKDFFFYRGVVSKHNTSAPDIRIAVE
jgi:hypothetical protein